MRNFNDPLSAGLSELHRSWGWLLALGVTLMVFGVICIIADVSATFATLLVFGWLLLLSGVVALVHVFTAHNWSGSLVYLLSALLRGFTGYLLVRYPGFGAVSLTLVLALFFVVGGIFRAVGAGMIHFPRWGWATFSGLLSIALGVILLAQLPVSSVWFIGFAIGVDAFFDGAALIGLATSVHHLSGPSAHQVA